MYKTGSTAYRIGKQRAAQILQPYLPRLQEDSLLLMMMHSWRNSLTSVPTWGSSSIYSGTFVERLQWGCSGIKDCVRIGQIVWELGLAGGLQNWIVGKARWTELMIET